jgi:hypothetical protein
MQAPYIPFIEEEPPTEDREPDEAEINARK